MNQTTVAVLSTFTPSDPVPFKATTSSADRIKYPVITPLLILTLVKSPPATYVPTKSVIAVSFKVGTLIVTLTPNPAFPAITPS